MKCKVCGSENTALITTQTASGPKLSLFAKNYDLPERIIQKIRCSECGNEFEL